MATTVQQVNRDLTSQVVFYKVNHINNEYTGLAEECRGMREGGGDCSPEVLHRNEALPKMILVSPTVCLILAITLAVVHNMCGSERVGAGGSY